MNLEEYGLEKGLAPIAFYFVVFGLAELTRKIVDGIGTQFFRNYRNSNFYVFLIEFIATAQMCTCVYENGIILKHFGWKGFGVTVATLLMLGSYMNRGAFVSPLMPLEQLIFKTITIPRFLAIFVAQCLGGWVAFRFAKSLWFWSYDYSADHSYAHDNTQCLLVYKVGLEYVAIWEFLGTFTIRFAVARLPSKWRNLIIPAFISSLLSFALVWIGVPGLNPLVASSRLWGCGGIDDQWFIFVYWVLPFAGWMTAVYSTRPLKEKAKVTQKPSEKQKNKRPPQTASKNGGGKRKAD